MFFWWDGWVIPSRLTFWSNLNLIWILKIANCKTHSLLVKILGHHSTNSHKLYKPQKLIPTRTHWHWKQSFLPEVVRPHDERFHTYSLKTRTWWHILTWTVSNLQLEQVDIRLVKSYIELVRMMIQESGIKTDMINDATLSLKHPRKLMTSTAS